MIRDVAESSDDTTQLRRTIFALVQVSRMEADRRKLELCTQMSTCYRYDDALAILTSSLIKISGILLLDHPVSFQGDAWQQQTLDAESDLSSETNSILEATLQMASRISQHFDLISGIISPFVLHVNYKAASIYIQQAIAHPDGDAAKHLAALKGSLKLFSRRWLVAGTLFPSTAEGLIVLTHVPDAYLSLLDRRESLFLMQQFNC